MDYPLTEEQRLLVDSVRAFRKKELEPHEAAVAGQTGFPVAVKLVADDLIHKTELNVVLLNLTGAIVADALIRVRSES